jgi:hypothetical protein
MKAYGIMEVDLHQFWISAPDGGEYLSSRSSCNLLGERAPVPIDKEAGWLQQPVWTFSREQSFAPAQIRSSDRPARSVVTKCNRFKILYNGAPTPPI